MSYKLTYYGNIVNLLTGQEFPAVQGNRDYADFLAWVAAGNTPEPADPEPPPAEGQAAETTARAWFAGHPAAVAFIRMTPAEQEAWIDAATTAQLKTLLKYLTMAVVVLIKRELL